MLETFANTVVRVVVKKNNIAECCNYCRKVVNIPLIQTPGDNHSGIKVVVRYRKKVKQATIEAFGWYDSFVGIDAPDIVINFCPMCGRKLN